MGANERMRRRTVWAAARRCGGVLAATCLLAFACTAVAPGAAWARGAGAESGATDAATQAVPDGTYEPSAFSWQGGSGRLKGIECTGVTVEAGAATATIVFESPDYVQVRVGDDVLDPVAVDTDAGTSTFEVPVVLGDNTAVSAMTTKMSQGHWIDYELYVAVAADGGSSSDGAAFALPGFSYDSAVPLSHARFVHACRYTGTADGAEAVLIEVDVAGARAAGAVSRAEPDTALACGVGAAFGDVLGSALDAAGAARATAPAAGATDADRRALPYEAGTVRYLAVPADASVPAGAAAQAIVVRQPVTNVVRAADDASSNAPDFRALVAQDCGAYVCTIGAVPDGDIAAWGSRFAALDLPLAVTCAQAEPDTAAADDWQQVEGLLLGAETA